MALLAVPAAASKYSPVHETENYRIYPASAALDPELLDPMPARCDRLFRRVQAFFGDAAPLPIIDYHVYPSFEAKGLATGDTRLAHADIEESAVHLVVNAWIAGDDCSRDATILIQDRLDSPATRFLEMGLAVYFSDGWRERGYGYWASRLYRSGNMPPLADLTDNDILRRESYLVVEPLAGSFVEFVLEKYGKDALLEHYATWQPDSSEVVRMEREWHDYLDELSSGYAKQIRNDRRRFPRSSGFKKGFCYAHEGYQIFNGYLSRKSDEALVKLQDIGTDAISITPFTYMRDPSKPVFLRFSNGAGAENDECVIHSSYTAKTLGMSVMLKPHIWLGRSWPGEIEMKSEADWAKFFDYYLRWIRHYALLAEIYEIDMLCIGVELSRATVGHEAEWRDIITKLRGLYSGELTYAANWGVEFETVSFWDDLDYIGINCYYPLSELDEASPEDLAQGVEQMMTRIESIYQRYDKPVLFTEIGFTSTNAPWKQPHESTWQKPVNLDHQAMCYDAVFEVLSGKSWCEGIYWWKWPSFLEFGGQSNPGFTPNNKPAQAVVEKWFGRPW